MILNFGSALYIKSIKITKRIISRKTKLRSSAAKLQDIQCIMNEAHKL